jgi:hypothetical protein
MPAITLFFELNFQVRHTAMPMEICEWATAKLIEEEGYSIAICTRSGRARLFSRRKRAR